MAKKKAPASCAALGLNAGPVNAKLSIYPAVLLSQSAILDTRRYTAQCFMYPMKTVHRVQLFLDTFCQIVIVIPSSLPPGSTPPPHPHPGNVVIIISTPAPRHTHTHTHTQNRRGWGGREGAGGEGVPRRSSHTHTHPTRPKGTPAPQTWRGAPAWPSPPRWPPPASWWSPAAGCPHQWPRSPPSRSGSGLWR